MGEPMESVGVSIPPVLRKRIDQHRARQGVITGNTPSRSEWFRDAAREKLDREERQADEAVSVEA